MTEITSLADQLKETIRQQKSSQEAKVKLHQKSLEVDRPLNEEKKDAELFFQLLLAFQVEGQEKVMIRLDSKTVQLLKRLKLATNVDMTKIIVFSLHQLFDANPWLHAHISKLLNQNEL